MPAHGPFFDLFIFSRCFGVSYTCDVTNSNLEFVTPRIKVFVNFQLLSLENERKSEVDRETESCRSFGRGFEIATKIYHYLLNVGPKHPNSGPNRDLRIWATGP